MLKVARFISPLYPFNIWDSKEMYVLFQQTWYCNVTIIVLRISLFGVAIYPNLLKDQPATSGDALMRKKKNTKPINRKWSQQNKRGKWAEERNTPELEITKTRKHKLPNWFSATMSSPTGSSYCKQNLLYRGETSQQGTQHNPWYRHWKTTLVTTRKNPVRYEKFESKGCSNHLTKPLPGPLRHTMILAENSSNQLYAAGEELCKPQLQQLICSIHQLSLTLKNSTKVANENLNQLSLTVQTIAHSTNTAR